MTVENSVSKTMAPLVEALDNNPGFDLGFLREAVGQLNISETWVDEMTEGKHEGDAYHRILVHPGSNYEIVLAVWPVGTQTLIHNHGSSNSFGMVRILRGDIFNHEYRRVNGALEPCPSEGCKPGELVCVPLDLVHQMGNASAEEYAVSLHVYSPAIVEVCYWDPRTRERCN